MKLLHLKYILSGIIALFLLFFVFYSPENVDRPLVYADVVREHGRPMSVSVDSVSYGIDGDTIYSTNGNGHISEKMRQRVFEVGALLFEARYAPLMAIAGTEPEALSDAVSALEDAIDVLASAQGSNEEAAQVRNTLYPTAFLRSLVRLEQDRLNFIENPTESNARQYEQAQLEAIQIGLSNALSFEDSLREAVQKESDITFPLYSLSGVITPEALLQSASIIVKRMNEVNEAYKTRKICREDMHSRCPIEIAMVERGGQENKVVESATEHSFTLEEMENIRGIETFFMDVAVRLGGIRRSTLAVRLNESACVREAQNPHTFMVYDIPAEGDKKRKDLQHFTGELLFIPTNIDGPVLNMFEADQISYVIVRPLSFYVCPQAQHDLGMLAAIKYAHETALLYSNLVYGGAAAIDDDNFLSEEDAKAYVEEALLDAEELSPSEIRQFEELSLMLDDRSARLDVLIHKIALVVKQRATQHQEGLPFEVSMPFMFLTHSAFPSLFLSHNSGAGLSDISLTQVATPEQRKQFLDMHKTFNELKKNTPVEKLVDDTARVRLVDLPY